MFDTESNRPFDNIDSDYVYVHGANILFEAQVEGVAEPVRGHVNFEPQGNYLRVSGGAYIEKDTTADINQDFASVRAGCTDFSGIIEKNARLAASNFGKVLSLRHRAGDISLHL